MPQACFIPLQTELDNLTGRAGYLSPPNGIIDALTSDLNGDRVQAELIGKQGKNFLARYTYLPANCAEPTDCSSSGVNICATGTSETEDTATVTITNCLQMPVRSFTMEQFRDLCSLGPSQLVTKNLDSTLIKMREAIAAVLMTDLCAAVGCFETGVTSKDLAMLDARRIPNWSSDEEIRLDFLDKGIANSPMLIGGRPLMYYMRGVDAGGNNLDGIDIGQMGKMPSFYERRINQFCPTDGGETLIALTPGVFQVINFLENVGMFATQWDNFTGDPLQMFQMGEIFQHGVIQDPVNGWMYDLNVVYDVCTKTWNMTLATRFDTVQLPLLGCNDACFNGILRYNLCPIEPLVCETTPT